MSYMPTHTLTHIESKEDQTRVHFIANGCVSMHLKMITELKWKTIDFFLSKSLEKKNMSKREIERVTFETRMNYEMNTFER